MLDAGVHKREQNLPSCVSPFSPPNSYSIPWMPPHWSPLWPWLPAGVPLTFSLWPPEPQRHRLNLLSRRWILGTTVMTTEGTDSEYRCYRYSSKLLLSLYLQHVLPKRAQKRSGSARPPLFFFFLFSIYGDAPGSKRRSCCSPAERCRLQRGSSYKRAVLSSLLKKCACCLPLL